MSGLDGSDTLEPYLTFLARATCASVAWFANVECAIFRQIGSEGYAGQADPPCRDYHILRRA